MPSMMDDATNPDNTVDEGEKSGPDGGIAQGTNNFDNNISLDSKEEEYAMDVTTTTSTKKLSGASVDSGAEVSSFALSKNAVTHTAADTSHYSLDRDTAAVNVMEKVQQPEPSLQKPAPTTTETLNPLFQVNITKRHIGKKPPSSASGKKNKRKSAGKKYHRKRSSTSLTRSDSDITTSSSRPRQPSGGTSKKRRNSSSYAKDLETSSVISTASASASSTLSASGGGNYYSRPRTQYKRQRCNGNEDTAMRDVEQLLLTDPLLTMVPHKSVTAQRNYHPLPPLPPPPSPALDEVAGDDSDENGGIENGPTATTPQEMEEETATPASTSSGSPPMSSPAITATTQQRTRIGDGSMGGTIPAAELMNSVNIVFHKPGTYSLPYLATLLGFDVPPAPTPNNGDPPSSSSLSSTDVDRRGSEYKQRRQQVHVPGDKSQSLGQLRSGDPNKIYTNGVSGGVVPKSSDDLTVISSSSYSDNKGGANDDAIKTTVNSRITKNDEINDDIDEKASSQLSSSERLRYGIPDPNTLRVRREDIFFQVPPEGNYYSHNRMMMMMKKKQQKQRKRTEKAQSSSTTSSSTTPAPSARAIASARQDASAEAAAATDADGRERRSNERNDVDSGDCDEDDMFDCMDPFYTTILNEGWDPRRVKPAVNKARRLNSLRTKVLQEERKQIPVREKVVNMAQKIIDMSPDWTFQDWTSYWTTVRQEQQLEKQKLQVERYSHVVDQKQHPQRHFTEEQDLIDSQEEPKRADDDQKQQQKEEQDQQQGQGDHQQQNQKHEEDGSDNDVEDDDRHQQLEDSAFMMSHMEESLTNASSDRSRTNKPLPDAAEQYLTAWANAHVLHPYPTEAERMQIMLDTGLTKQKVLHWFKNFRSRRWKLDLNTTNEQSTGCDQTSIAMRANGVKLEGGGMLTNKLKQATEAKSTNESSAANNNNKKEDRQNEDDYYKYPVWTMGGQDLFTSISGFGIVACYKGDPVAVLRYNFQWYHLPIMRSSAKEAYANTLSTETTNDQLVSSSMEAELIMVVEGMGIRTQATGTNSKQREADVDSNRHTVDSSAETTEVNASLVCSGLRVATNYADAVSTSSPLADSSLRTFNQTSVESTTALGTPDGLSVPTLNTGTSVVTYAGYLDEKVRIVMLALAFEHARACSVWYSYYDIPKSEACITKKCFRMVEPSRIYETRTTPDHVVNGLKNARDPNRDKVQLLCDLSKCSSRYALLRFKKDEIDVNNNKRTLEGSRPQTEADHFSERLVVHLPSHEDARSCFDVAFGSKQRSTRIKGFTDDRRVFQNTCDNRKGAHLRLQVVLDGTEQVTIQKLFDKQAHDECSELKTPTIEQHSNENVGTELDPRKATIPTLGPAVTSTSVGTNMYDVNGSIVTSGDGNANLSQELGGSVLFLDILNHFPLSHSSASNDNCNEILRHLTSKQNELAKIENEVEGRARNLLIQTYEERKAYDVPEALQMRISDEQALREHARLVEERKELDQVWQEQLEEEMNAVCSICNDGEVTPDNQIIFCDSCNVAVHQMCYGIDQVPEGDYFCIACIHFRRDKISERRAAGHASAQKPSPLPIVCELCPIKQGAYTRTETLAPLFQTTSAKWVHMTCAKWQGLDFIVKGRADLVEDVGELKDHFLRLGISCTICKGRRGAYNNCRQEGCDKWMHVSCARASGVCEVIHGEDVDGPVTENAWTLMCPDHSEVPQAANGEKAKHIIPIELLIKAANEFPPEPTPPPLPQSFKPFNKLTAEERVVALSDRKYEQEFIEEITTKKLAGVRCEVCDIVDDDHMSRCTLCGVCVCFSCQIHDDPEVIGQRHFKCLACRFLVDKDDGKQGGDCTSTPHCKLCNQNGGLLLHAGGKPLTKLSYWRKNLKEFENSLFSKLQWTHFCCAFWGHHDNVIIHKECKVDCSNVIMSNGMGFVLGKNRCGLCGMKNGLKAKCAKPACRTRWGDRQVPCHFHATCARQAGFELDHHDGPDAYFYVNCYFHSGNENNLRARLEDLIEIERRRAGKQFWKSNGPMRFTDGCRLLNGSILVMRILGWAWRWAEWWVECGSTWEPLLEPGQVESEMSDNQLRIVNSTPQSRRDDARRCRLAALGAALRNRDYDIDEGFDTMSLERALGAVLHTPSLVGPLKKEEIDFFTDWLGRAYRSKSRLLGFGDDKVPVANDGFCVHIDDRSPKFELGSRPLPGKQVLPEDQLFEIVLEPDDFLRAVSGDGKEIKWVPTDEVEYKRKRERRADSALKSPKERTNSRKGLSGSKKRQIDHASLDRDDTDQPPKKKLLAAATPMSDGCKLKLGRSPLPIAEIFRDELDAESQFRRRSFVGRPPRSFSLSILITVNGQHVSLKASQSTDFIPRQDTPDEPRRKEAPTQRVTKETSSRKAIFSSEITGAHDSAVSKTRQKLLISSDRLWEHPLLDQVDIFEVFPIGNRKDFVSEMGWSSKDILSVSMQEGGNKYAAWRNSKDYLEPLPEGFEHREFTKMKEKVLDKLKEKINDSETSESLATIESSKSPGRPRKMSRKTNGRSFKKRGRTILDPFDVLTESMKKFARSVGLTTARSFVDMSNAEYAVKYMAFRRQEGLSKLADKTSASSVLANHKRLIRDAALKLGDHELATSYARGPRRALKSGAENAETGPVEVDAELEDNDFCMYCGETGELIICDGCNQSCHLTCLDPPLMDIPDGDWYCPECSQKRPAKEDGGGNGDDNDH